MKNKHYSLLIYVCIIYLFSSLSFSIRAQLKVKASGLVAKEEDFQISFIVPASNIDECYDIAKIELLNLNTQKITVLNAPKGETTQLKKGEHIVTWNFKENNFFIEDEFDIHIYLKQSVCQSNTFGPMNSGAYKPRSMVLKVLTGAVGVASGLYALSLKSKYDSKQSVFNAVELSIFEKGGEVNGEIYLASDYNKWKTAYNDLKAARNPGLLNTMVATSIISLGYEIFLLTTKAKIKDSNFSLRPSANQYGLSFVYTLK